MALHRSNGWLTGALALAFGLALGIAGEADADRDSRYRSHDPILEVDHRQRGVRHDRARYDRLHEPYGSRAYRHDAHYDRAVDRFERKQQRRYERFHRRAEREYYRHGNRARYERKLARFHQKQARKRARFYDRQARKFARRYRGRGYADLYQPYGRHAGTYRGSGDHVHGPHCRH